MSLRASAALQEPVVERTSSLSRAGREWIVGPGARLLGLTDLQARVLATCLESRSFTLDWLWRSVGSSKQAAQDTLARLQRRGLMELTAGVREGRYNRRVAVMGSSLRALLSSVEGARSEAEAAS